MTSETPTTIIDSFLQRFPSAYQMPNLLFAYYASFATIFSPDYLYQLWLFFLEYKHQGQLQKLPSVVVSDLLQSGFCEQVAFELYELDDVLCKELKTQVPQICEKEGIHLFYTTKDVASLTREYADQYYKYSNRQNLFDMLYWKSMFILDYPQAIKELKETLDPQSSSHTDRKAQVYLEIAQIQAGAKAQHLATEDIQKLPTFSFDVESEFDIRDEHLVEVISGLLGLDTVVNTPEEQMKVEGKPIEIANLERLLKVTLEEISFDKISTSHIKRAYSINDRQEVIALALRNLEITDVSFLKDFPHLKKLYFGKNSITDISPIKSLSKLERLGLNQNQITEIPLDFFNDLPSLEMIYLKENPIQNIPKEIFDKSESSLLDLVNYASHHQLVFGNHPLDAERIIQEAQEKQLETIDLGHLNLSKIPEEVYELTHLKTLILGSHRSKNRGGMNSISSISDKIVKLQNLENIYLSDNFIQSLPQSIIQLKKLKTLGLTRNEIVEIPEIIFQITSLETLYLSGNPLRDISLKILDLYNLQKLGLNGVKIPGFPEEIEDLEDCWKQVKKHLIELEQLDQNQFNEKNPTMLSEENKRNIEIRIAEGKLTDDEILDFIYKGIINKEELMNKSLISEKQFKRLFSPIVQVDFGSWANLPRTLPEGRVDIFVIGIVGSGKSCFLAGLLNYADKLGKLDLKIDNTIGYGYANSLIEAVQEGLVPPPTPVEYLQYISGDLVDKNNDKHPLTFVEMSGEVFHDTYLKSLSEINPTFRSYLFENQNPKYIFFAIDYLLDTRTENYQKKHIDYLLNFLDQQGTLNSIEGITILITKLDGALSASVQKKAKSFLEMKYQSLTVKCEELSKKYGFSFHIFKFSLGDFEFNGRTYQYIPDDSENIFNLLCETTSFTSKPKSKGWWNRFFK